MRARGRGDESGERGGDCVVGVDVDAEDDIRGTGFFTAADGVLRCKEDDTLFAESGRRGVTDRELDREWRLGE